MFRFFKKNAKNIEVSAPSDGVLKAITDVSDEMFSKKIMGDGYALEPSSDSIYAPISGTITSVFPTQHAVSFKNDEGIELLLHLGVDTVELNGEPFNIRVSEGSLVKAGDPLGVMSRKQIQEAGKSCELIMVITNMEKVASLSETKLRTVKHGESIGKIIMN